LLKLFNFSLYICSPLLAVSPLLMALVVMGLAEPLAGVVLAEKTGLVLEWRIYQLLAWLSSVWEQVTLEEKGEWSRTEILKLNQLILLIKRVCL